MGKSPIINSPVPDAQARVSEVSEALDSGKHTTTSARLYHLEQGIVAADDLPALEAMNLTLCNPKL